MDLDKNRWLEKAGVVLKAGEGKRERGKGGKQGNEKKRKKVENIRLFHLRTPLR